jgi:hypothetical protein
LKGLLTLMTSSITKAPRSILSPENMVHLSTTSQNWNGTMPSAHIVVNKQLLSKGNPYRLPPSFNLRCIYTGKRVIVLWATARGWQNNLHTRVWGYYTYDMSVCLLASRSAPRHALGTCLILY